MFLRHSSIPKKLFLLGVKKIKVTFYDFFDGFKLNLKLS